MGLDTSSEDVASEVRSRMARLRLSQQVVSERSGIAASTLSRKLMGGSEFTVSELYRLADVLGVPVSALLPKPAEATA